MTWEDRLRRADRAAAAGLPDRRRRHLRAAARRAAVCRRFDVAAQVWHNLGLELHREGDAASATAALVEALAAAELEGDQLLLARVWNTSGLIARDADDLGEAEDRHARAIDLTRGLTGGEAVETHLRARLDHAVVRKDRGFLHEARAALDEVHLACTDRDLHDLRGHALIALGLVHELLHRPGRARAAYEEASDAFRTSGAEHLSAVPLHNLGLLHLAADELDEARGRLAEALALNQELGLIEAAAVDLGALAVVERAAGSDQEARRLYKEALPVLLEARDAREAAKCAGELAELERDMGDVETAIACLEPAVDLAAAVGEVRSHHELARLRGDLLAGANRLDAAEAEYEDALRLSDELRAGLDDEADALAYFDDDHDDLHERLIRLAVLRGDARTALERIERARAPELRRRLGRRPQDGPAPPQAPLTLDQALQLPALRNGAALVELYLGPTALYLGVARAGEEPRLELVEMDRAALRGAVDAALTALDADQDRAELPQGGPLATLAVVLRRVLRSDEKVWLVPHDCLHRLPLGLLGRPDLDALTITTLPSRTALQVTTVPPAGAPPVLVCPASRAAPVLLAAAHRRSVTSRWPGCDVLSPATRATVVGRLTAIPPQLLYVAAHGRSDPERPFAGGVLLDDGLLRVRDVLPLGLRGTVVCLVACSSGPGVARPGDELLGMSRALLAAGARAAVVALWSVPELATWLLFDTFLRGDLDAGGLHRAQSALRRCSVDEATDRVIAVRDGWPASSPETHAVMLEEAAMRLGAGDRDGAALLYDRVADEAEGPLAERARRGRRAAGLAGHGIDRQAPFAHPWFWAGFVMVGDGALRSLDG
ncbi:CHAT domain-containing protein [Actinomycetospora soli]|uniref:CHAT domain-containing protein n=1 Tax=Actinomycetospora soli TaxID=2893887 RepID=UPI001E393D91|nr:CHAT domain-containing protein [Actinomycetospora soli]MCD2187818.1 CHAT domain-containing tetratricopeptide repeat protein [Actinomycetospora soli]